MRAAAEAGFARYDPDARLINRYLVGAKLGPHQDRDEKDARAPNRLRLAGPACRIPVGGKRRSDPMRRLLV